MWTRCVIKASFWPEEDKNWYLPNIFVSAVGNEVKGGEVAVNRQQVQTQQHYQDLNDNPHEGGARTQSQNLWTEPTHTHRQNTALNLSHAQQVRR